VTGYAVGDTISIPNAGVGGGTLTATITGIDTATKTLALNTVVSATVAGQTVLVNSPAATSGSLTGSIDITSGAQLLNVASTSGFAIGDTITIAGAGAAGADLTATIQDILGNQLMLNSSASVSISGQTVTNNAVGAGGANYSADTLRSFNAQANVTIGGNQLITGLGSTAQDITQTPILTGNVFIGNDGAVNLQGQNLSVSTQGNIKVYNVGPVHSLGLVAGGSGGLTLLAFNTTGGTGLSQLLFKGDVLSMPSAATNYAMAAGSTVTLQPYTLSNSVGVYNALDYFHTAQTAGTIAAGSDLLVVNSISGFSIGNTIDVIGAGTGGATLTTTSFAQGQQVSLGTSAATTTTNVTVTVTHADSTTTSTQGWIEAGSSVLVVSSSTSFQAGESIKITGAGT
jgi:hypothetical protein